MDEEPITKKRHPGAVVAAILLIMALIAGGGFLIGTYIVNPAL